MPLTAVDYCVAVKDLLIFSGEGDADLMIFIDYRRKVAYKKERLVFFFCLSQKDNNGFVGGDTVDPLKTVWIGIQLIKGRMRSI